MLPKSAGRRIEHLSARDIATYLIAISTARTAADATRSVFTWGGMTPNGEPRRQGKVGEVSQCTLIEMITMITAMISIAWDGNGVGPLADAICASTLEITTTHPHAIIELAGRRTEYLPIGGEVPSGRQRVDRIPGATIHQIAMALREGAPIPTDMPPELAESFPFDLLKSA
jgi:hypothetical protein